MTCAGCYNSFMHQFEQNMCYQFCLITFSPTGLHMSPSSTDIFMQTLVFIKTECSDNNLNTSFWWELLSLDLYHPPCAISSCLFASPRAENRSSLILVSALRLFSRCWVFSCMADSADINTSVSFSFSLYLRSSCVRRESNGSRQEKWQWDFNRQIKRLIQWRTNTNCRLKCFIVLWHVLFILSHLTLSLQISDLLLLKLHVHAELLTFCLQLSDTTSEGIGGLHSVAQMRKNCF